MARGVTNRLITAAVHPNKIATKDQIIEKAKEVVAGGTRKGENIRKLDDIIKSKEIKDMKRPWNEIIARTCEVFRAVDGNILCPACLNVTPNTLTICLHCHGRFMSCGTRNTVATTTIIEIDDDDEEIKVKKDVEMEQPKDHDKGQQDWMDEATMNESKDVMQSEVTDNDEEDEEVSLEFIDKIMAQSAAHIAEQKPIPLHSARAR